MGNTLMVIASNQTASTNKYTSRIMIEVDELIGT